MKKLSLKLSVFVLVLLSVMLLFTCALAAEYGVIYRTDRRAQHRRTFGDIDGSGGGELFQYRAADLITDGDAAGIDAQHHIEGGSCHAGGSRKGVREQR